MSPPLSTATHNEAVGHETAENALAEATGVFTDFVVVGWAVVETLPS